MSRQEFLTITAIPVSYESLLPVRALLGLINWNMVGKILECLDNT